VKTNLLVNKQVSLILLSIGLKSVHPDELIALIEGGAIQTTQKLEDKTFARIYRGYLLGSLNQWVGGHLHSYLTFFSPISV
jgi:hypothetical protein